MTSYGKDVKLFREFFTFIDIELAQQTNDATNGPEDSTMPSTSAESGEGLQTDVRPISCSSSLTSVVESASNQVPKISESTSALQEPPVSNQIEAITESIDNQNRNVFQTDRATDLS